MTDRVEFGLRLPVAGPLASQEGVARVAQRAQELGFHTLWVHDFIVWTREQDQTHVSCGSIEAVKQAQQSDDYVPQFYESLISLAYVAGLTSSIRLGVAVLCLPYRNPVVTAKQVATLDNLSRGRLTLGIGVGAPRSTLNQDFEVLGIPRSDKYRRTIEHLRAMRTIWTERFPSFEGRYLSFPPTELNPKPVQSPYPPLWFGGKGDRALELAAEFGTGWLPGGMSPDEYRERVAALRAAAGAKGRSEVDFTIGMEVSACIGRTSDEAHQASRATFGLLAPAFAVYEAREELVYASSLVGSTDEFRERTRQFVEAGVRHFELKPIYQSIDHLLDQMELISSAVMPDYR